MRGSMGWEGRGCRSSAAEAIAIQAATRFCREARLRPSLTSKREKGLVSSRAQPVRPRVPFGRPAHLRSTSKRASFSYGEQKLFSGGGIALDPPRG